MRRQRGDTENQGNAHEQQEWNAPTTLSTQATPRAIAPHCAPCRQRHQSSSALLTYQQKKAFAQAKRDDQAVAWSL
jgi:hypothetical protein